MSQWCDLRSYDEVPFCPPHWRAPNLKATSILVPYRSTNRHWNISQMDLCFCSLTVSWFYIDRGAFFAGFIGVAYANSCYWHRALTWHVMKASASSDRVSNGRWGLLYLLHHSFISLRAIDIDLDKLSSLSLFAKPPHVQLDAPTTTTFTTWSASSWLRHWRVCSRRNDCNSRRRYIFVSVSC